MACVRGALSLRDLKRYDDQMKPSYSQKNSNSYNVK